MAPRDFLQPLLTILLWALWTLGGERNTWLFIRHARVSQLRPGVCAPLASFAPLALTLPARHGKQGAEAGDHAGGAALDEVGGDGEIAVGGGGVVGVALREEVGVGSVMGNRQPGGGIEIVVQIEAPGEAGQAVRRAELAEGLGIEFDELAEGRIGGGIGEQGQAQVHQKGRKGIAPLGVGAAIGVERVASQGAVGQRREIAEGVVGAVEGGGAGAEVVGRPMAFQPGEAAGLIGNRAAKERVEGVERVAAIGAAGPEDRQGQARQGVGIEDVEQGTDEVAVVGVEGTIGGAVERMAFERGQIEVGQGVQVAVEFFGDEFPDEVERFRRRRGQRGNREPDGQERDKHFHETRPSRLRAAGQEVCSGGR